VLFIAVPAALSHADDGATPATERSTSHDCLTNFELFHVLPPLIDCISTLFGPRATIGAPAPRSHGLTHAGVEASVNLAWFQLPGAVNGDREATS
jgi:hypothetical protein